MLPEGAFPPWSLPSKPPAGPHPQLRARGRGVPRAVQQRRSGWRTSVQHLQDNLATAHISLTQDEVDATTAREES